MNVKLNFSESQPWIVAFFCSYMLVVMRSDITGMVHSIVFYMFIFMIKYQMVILNNATS